MALSFAGPTSCTFFLSCYFDDWFVPIAFVLKVGSFGFIFPWLSMMVLMFEKRSLELTLLLNLDWEEFKVSLIEFTSIYELICCCC